MMIRIILSSFLVVLLVHWATPPMQNNLLNLWTQIRYFFNPLTKMYMAIFKQIRLLLRWLIEFCCCYLLDFSENVLCIKMCGISVLSLIENVINFVSEIAKVSWKVFLLLQLNYFYRNIAENNSKINNTLSEHNVLLWQHSITNLDIDL